MTFSSKGEYYKDELPIVVLLVVILYWRQMLNLQTFPLLKLLSWDDLTSSSILQGLQPLDCKTLLWLDLSFNFILKQIQKEIYLVYCIRVGRFNKVASAD